MAGSLPDTNVEKSRITYAFWLAVIGFIIAAVLVIFLVIQARYESKDIVAVAGLFTSVLGTLVGAFFGLQIGSSGRETAQQAANSANSSLNRALAALAPQQAQAVLDQAK